MTIDSPATRAELREALDRLVRRAYRNGVTVGNGGYELVQHDAATPDWDLTIIRVE